jgi:hypothetical protein
MNYSYKPITKTQINTFNKLLEKYENTSSTITGSYNTIIVKSIIYGRCECGNEYEKKCSQILISGPFCKKCTYEKANVKREQTNINNHGVSNISKSKNVKLKKKIKLTKKFTEWIKDIEEKKLNLYWEYKFNEINGYDKHHEMKHIKCGKVSFKSPSSHLKQDKIDTFGQGCLYCYQNSKRMVKEDFINMSKKKWGDRFSGYNGIPKIIKNNHTLIQLFCNKHGTFKTTYTSHLDGEGGCKKCSDNSLMWNEFKDKHSEELFKRGIEIINNKRDNEIIYNNDKILLKCLNNTNHPNWQANVYNIKSGSGCPQTECVNQKIENTCMFKYSCKNPMSNFEIKKKATDNYLKNCGKIQNPEKYKEIQTKKKNTSNKNWGVDHPSQNPKIHDKQMKNMKKWKLYKFPSGREDKIQGYENFALDELLKTYNEDEISTERIRIPYINKNGESKYHFTDIYIKKDNLIIEVKSTWTFKLKDNIFEKKEGTINLGYKYEIWCYDKNGNKLIY